MREENELRRKVDDLLREALAEPDEQARAHLIGKATYWNQLAMKKSGHDRLRSNPWEPRVRAS